MPFSEGLKLQVKRRAAFRCCRCQSIGIDVHHITPEKDGGADDMSNAAPLCQNCHDQFGDNPLKRKEITQMRDWWYEECKKFSDIGPPMDVLRKIDKNLEAIRQSQQSDMSELKSMLKKMSDSLIDDMTPETAGATASGIVNTSSGASATHIGEKVYANFRCNSCGTMIGLLIGSDKCPTCGATIG